MTPTDHTSTLFEIFGGSFPTTKHSGGKYLIRRKQQQVMNSKSKYFQSFSSERKEQASVIRYWLGTRGTQFHSCVSSGQDHQCIRLLGTEILKDSPDTWRVVSWSELVSTVSFFSPEHIKQSHFLLSSELVFVVQRAWPTIPQ